MCLQLAFLLWVLHWIMKVLCLLKHVESDRSVHDLEFACVIISLYLEVVFIYVLPVSINVTYW
jgi:hypothetical protein